MTTATLTGRHWQARPTLAAVLRCVLLAVPLVASSAAVYAVARYLTGDRTRTWWGLALLLVTGVLVAVGVERGARRLLPIALLLKLSMIFPDRAPSRLKLARKAALRRPTTELLWNGHGAQPTSTSDLVLALVSALGTHDRRTRGHSERVRLLCDMLAVELHLDAESRDRLRWAALLHDVGKVEVSPRILNKPGRLDRSELTRIQLHPQLGAALAAPLMPWLGTWGDGILDHHEHYDGSGYPHGKAGEQISQAGRLIGLIDAYETMTATRPYKKAMATRAAREELARCAGTHFDPLYVRAFLAISLPRLLWAMGPAAFALQLPFLQPIAQGGARAAAAAPQGAGALAAGAAGATVLVTGGIAGGHVGQSAPPDRPPLAGSQQQAQAPVGPVPLTLGNAQPSTSSALGPAAVAGAGGATTLQDEALVGGPTSPSAAPGEVAAAAEPTAAADPAPGGEPAPGAEAGPGGAAAPEPEPERQPEPQPESQPEQQPEPQPEARPTSEPASSAAREPAAQPESSREHPVIRSGPSSPTSSRRATFTLAEEPGRTWECKLRGAADGEDNRWEPCSGTFTITVRRDGQHVLRVRDAASTNQVDSWTWEVRG